MTVPHGYSIITGWSLHYSHRYRLVLSNPSSNEESRWSVRRYGKRQVRATGNEGNNLFVSKWHLQIRNFRTSSEEQMPKNMQLPSLKFQIWRAHLGSARVVRGAAHFSTWHRSLEPRRRRLKHSCSPRGVRSSTRPRRRGHAGGSACCGDGVTGQHAGSLFQYPM